MENRHDLEKTVRRKVTQEQQWLGEALPFGINGNEGENRTELEDMAVRMQDDEPQDLVHQDQGHTGARLHGDVRGIHLDLQRGIRGKHTHPSAGSGSMIFSTSLN